MHSRSGSVLCVGLTIAVGSITVWAQPDETKPHCRLEVLLTTTLSLPEAARVSMLNEAATIWRNHGVNIDWLPDTAIRPVSPDRLRVLVIEKRKSLSGPGEATTVGELLRPSNGHAVAIVSVDSAQHLVATVRTRFGFDLVAADRRRLGLVLGRALAHEIGHYLLDTHTHARHGLMRPRFDALEFTDFRDGPFTLDRKASDWLKTRATSDHFAYAN